MNPRNQAVSVASLDLLARSRSTLEAACRAVDASERYRDAQLGALRAAAALLAARSLPSARSRPRNVWQSLPESAPELGEWADFFAASSRRQSVLDRGGWISARDADDLLRQAEMFLELVSVLLGVAPVALPEVLTPVMVSRGRNPVLGSGV